MGTILHDISATVTPHRPIPLLDVRRQTGILRKELDAAIARVLDHSQFIHGPEVGELEARIASYCGSRHAVACASGSDALLLPLSVLGVGPGTSVITSPFTFFATGGSIARLGAEPVFGEIEHDTFNLDPDWLRGYLADCSATQIKSIRAIIPIHLFGHSADMEAINQIAAAYEIRVIEDAAQAIGAEFQGRRAGSLGWCAAFSFFPSKNLGGLGDGGLITTDDPELADNLRLWRFHGGGGGYSHRYVGMNSRLDTLQAAALLVKLEHLDEWTHRRRENADEYHHHLPALLGNRVTLPVEREHCKHVYNQFTVRVRNRDAVRSRLSEAGIGSAVYYPIPLHLQECFAYLGHRKGGLPVSEAATEEVLALPIEAGLTTQDIRAVCEALARAVDHDQPNL